LSRHAAVTAAGVRRHVPVELQNQQHRSDRFAVHTRAFDQAIDACWLEGERISTSCRGYLLQLEQEGILSPLQREIVIDRLVALDGDDVDIDRLKWLVLMVLSSQPGQEQACARMEDLLFDESDALPN